MKIVQLTVEGYLRIKALDIVPEGNTVVITGKNGQGKSSVMNAIVEALDHASIAKTVLEPVNHDEEKARITLDIGDYIITRKFHRKEDGDTTTSLVVERPDGDKVTKPQTILNELVGALSFDPLEFAEKKDPEKRQILLDIIGVDVDEFDREHSEHYDARTIQNREKKRLNGMLEPIQPPTDEESGEEQSPSDLIAQLREANDARDDVERNERLEASLKEQLDNLKDQYKECLSDRKKFIHAVTQTEDPEKLQAQLEGIESTNKRAREVAAFRKTKEAFDLVVRVIEQLEAKMELSKINKAEALEDADLPIDGLEITPDGVLFGGTPFSQLCSSEQIKISMAIAMSLNPKLRIARILRGGELDSESMKLIETMAIDNNFQIWIEKVADEEGTGVYIYDGAIQKEGERV